MKRKRGLQIPVETPGPKTGVAWYRADQWARLLEISQDRDRLDESYDEWRQKAEQMALELKARGVDIVAMPVDVQDLLAWCQARGLPVIGPIRAAYVKHLVEVRYGMRGKGQEER